jgi:hypothetical protein
MELSVSGPDPLVPPHRKCRVEGANVGAGRLERNPEPPL